MNPHALNINLQHEVVYVLVQSVQNVLNILMTRIMLYSYANVACFQFSYGREHFLCFVDCASLYNVVNKTNLVHNFFLVFDVC